MPDGILPTHGMTNGKWQASDTAQSTIKTAICQFLSFFINTTHQQGNLYIFASRTAIKMVSSIYCSCSRPWRSLTLLFSKYQKSSLVVQCLAKSTWLVHIAHLWAVSSYHEQQQTSSPKHTRDQRPPSFSPNRPGVCILHTSGQFLMLGKIDQTCAYCTPLGSFKLPWTATKIETGSSTGSTQIALNVTPMSQCYLFSTLVRFF